MNDGTDWLLRLGSFVVVFAFLALNVWVQGHALTVKGDKKIKYGKFVLCSGIILFGIGFIIWGVGAFGGPDSADFVGYWDSALLISAGAAVMVSSISIAIRGDSMNKSDSAEAAKDVMGWSKIIFGCAIFCLIAFTGISVWLLVR